jgi:hypothetical protein
VQHPENLRLYLKHQFGLPTGLIKPVSFILESGQFFAEFTIFTNDNAATFSNGLDFLPLIVHEGTSYKGQSLAFIYKNAISQLAILRVYFTH